MDDTPTDMTREQIDRLADQIAITAARIDAANHELLLHIRRFDEVRGWAVQGAKSCAHWLSWRIGIGLAAARERVRVARALSSLPQIADALREGKISYAKTRAMTRVADTANEDLLLDMAKGATGAQLERVCARFRGLSAKDNETLPRYVHRRAMPDGTIRIEMRLLPDEAERVWQALRETQLAYARAAGAAHDATAETSIEGRCTKSVPTEAADSEDDPARPNMADAAVALAERQLAALERDATASCGEKLNEDRPRRPSERRQIMIHLSEHRLRDQSKWNAELHDGSFLCGETLRRIACDSGIVAVKTDGRGDVLDVGRRRRSVSLALLRALLVRDRHCRFPGCNHSVFVDAHHLEHWCHGGETSLANLLLLCHAHHVAVHEGGFRVERSPDGELTFFDAQGKPIERAPARPEVGADVLEELRQIQLDSGVHIDRTTSLPDWDGRNLDMFSAVGALVGRAQRAASPPSR